VKTVRMAVDKTQEHSFMVLPLETKIGRIMSNQTDFFNIEILFFRNNVQSSFLEDPSWRSLVPQTMKIPAHSS